MNALVALPDNKHALAGYSDNLVELFSINDGAILRTMRNHYYIILNLTLMPDGLRFVSGSGDNTACVVYHGLAPSG